MKQPAEEPIRIKIVHEPQTSGELAFNWMVALLAMIPIAICVLTLLSSSR